MAGLYWYILSGCRYVGIPISIKEGSRIVRIYDSDWLESMVKLGVWDEDGYCIDGGLRYHTTSKKLCREIYYKSGGCKTLIYINDSSEEEEEVYRWLELDGGGYYNERYMLL